MKKNHENTATIWTASTAQALGLTRAAASLDEAEIARMRRLKRVSDRDRFHAARALLRHALSEAVDGQVAPEQWRYRTGANGKPMLAPELPQLEFNLSHAGGCVAVGVSTSGPIGVDIESAVPSESLEAVRDALSARERACLCQLPDDEKWGTFIQYWTIKEACAKALGVGVSLDFRELEVVLNPPRVGTPRGLLGANETFDIQNRPIVVDRHPYCLSIAKITEEAGNSSFSFRPLAVQSWSLVDSIAAAPLGSAF